MQTRNYLPKKMYAKSSIDETEYNPIVYERKEKVLLFNELRRAGCSEKLATRAIKTPRSTLFRWKKQYQTLGLAGLEKESTAPNRRRQRKWPASLEQKVLSLRKQNPLYGKNKIKVILARDWNIIVSVSAIGRIISMLIKKGLIQDAAFYYARRSTRPRLFTGHAQRWKKGMKAKIPGELIQIDHMSVSVGVFSAMHFQAICPITKLVVEEAYHAATSEVASRFLQLVRQQMPFAIKSIQVDGGSEFKGEFEQACKIAAISLFVLPPRSPECNGTVERANGAAKFEFYHLYEGAIGLSHLRRELKYYVQKYNTFRPHQALQYLTPLEYYQRHEASVSNVVS